MLEAWRIVRKQHAATAFSGDGAAKTGGRWNSRGVPVIYTSGTKSLAALEVLVHLNPPLPFHYAAIRIRFDPALVQAASRKALPVGWQLEPPPASCQRVGDIRVRSARSPILALPSVIIPDEVNYILNPAHPDFKKISIGKPEKFTFDPRLLG